MYVLRQDARNTVLTRASRSLTMWGS